MKSRAVRSVVTAGAVVVVGLCGARAQSNPSSVASPETSAKPLFLERNEGELRTRRIRTDNKAVPAREFMLKVGPKNESGFLWPARRLPQMTGNPELIGFFVRLVPEALLDS
jgi:hypothetical protein